MTTPSKDILFIILTGFWVPVFLLAGLYYFLRRVDMQRDRWMQMDREDRSRQEIAMLSAQQDEIRSAMANMSELNKSYMTSAFEQMNFTISQKLDVLTREQLNFLASQRSISSREELKQSKVLDEGPSAALVIREISHALNTPLSHIEAGLLILAGQSSAQVDAPSQQGRLDALTASVQSCKSILAGFREAILRTSSGVAWSPSSLREALLSLVNMSAESLSKKTILAIDVADSIKGYSNNYIVTILAPLIENAVEAALPNTTVRVTSSYGIDQSIVFQVESTPASLPDSDEIYRDGFTTKEGHTGMGLSIVRHLLTAVPGATLRHAVNGGVVTFVIMLPGRS